MKRTKTEIQETVNALKAQIKRLDEDIAEMEKAGHDCPNTKKRREQYAVAVDVLESHLNPCPECSRRGQAKGEHYQRTLYNTWEKVQI